MQTVYYRKHFLSGNLTGLTVPCSLSYPTVSACATTIYIGKRGTDWGTRSQWIVTDASFQSFTR